MIKICFVTTIYLTYHSFLKKLSKYLIDTGEYDVSLICKYDRGIEDDLPQGVHFYPVKMERGVSLSAASAIRAIEKILREQRFDIVQYSTPNAALYTSIAAKKAHIPVRLYCQWGIRYMGFEGWRRSIFKYLEKKTCDNSTFIEAESHNIRSFSISEKLYVTDRSSVIWNGSACGVDLCRFDITKKEQWCSDIRRQYSINKDDVVFAFAARLTADKGINELLEAFINLQEDFANAKLLVMGRMDNRDSIKQKLFKQAEKCSKVIFTGNVENIEQYYAASDVFVAPSYREGFGLVVVEAEAMGLPAIVSDVPGQIDAIVPNKTGLTCKVKDVKNLESVMRKLMQDKKYRRDLGKAAVEFAKRDFEQKKLFGYLKQHRDELIRQFGGNDNAQGECFDGSI